MIYIIHEMQVLTSITLKIVFLNAFLRSIIDFYLFIIFFILLFLFCLFVCLFFWKMHFLKIYTIAWKKNL